MKASTGGKSGGKHVAMQTSRIVRRTQAERTATMKHRLIEATLDALVDVGYADFTFSHVVERAGVSRGAPLHHFPSKAALVEAAAETLIRELSDRVVGIWQIAETSPDPVRTFCLTLWREIYNARQGAMLAELSHASRHSAELAVIVSRLWTEAYQVLTAMPGSRSPAGGDDASVLTVPVGRVMMMSTWFMRGMAEDAHLGAAEGLFEAYLESWIGMLRSHPAD